jgi:hypothetical protein
MPRALLLADGQSDEPLGLHVARMAARHGCDLDIVAPDLRRLEPPPGHSVSARLEAVFAFDEDFDLVIIHRDAEAQSPDARRSEVLEAVGAYRVDLPVLPVIPVRMTDAWLLVDEEAIRRVAGRPSGTEPLGLPTVGQIEQIPDAKAVLQEALAKASGSSGRRLRRFKRDFGGQRRRLLEGLDHDGPVSGLAAWQELVASVEDAVSAL